MASIHLYRGFVLLIGCVYLYLLIMNWSLILFILLSLMWICFGVFLLFKKNTPIHVLGEKVNVLFYLCQCILCIFCIIKVEFAFVFFLLAFALEWTRLTIANKWWQMQKEWEQVEIERKHINETFHLVRSERHDFLKHVAALHYILHNQELASAKEYIDTLVDGYEETNLSIKGERGVVAGVLHQVYQRGKESGIEIVYDLDIPVSTLPLSDKRIVEFLSNLLSNAIEACEEYKQVKQKAILTVQFYKRSGIYIFICQNSCLAIDHFILDHLYHQFGYTTKTGKHEGLGTKIISNIVKEHNGTFLSHK